MQSWFEEEEQNLIQELAIKLENLDARDTRQLNEVYAEVKRVEGVSELGKLVFSMLSLPSGLLRQVHDCQRFENCSERHERATQASATTPPATIEPPIAVLVIACNRESYIRRTLDSLLK